MDNVYNGYCLLCIHCLKLELHKCLCLCVFFSFNIKFWSLYISYPVKIIPEAILPFGSLGYKYILLM